MLDETEYKKGILISEGQMEKINLKKRVFHGEWNYIIKPT